MKTIEQLQEEHAKELAKLQREHAVANSMPIPPVRVMDCGKRRAPWVTYEAQNLLEALAIFDKMTIVNMEHAKGKFTHICPPGDRYEPEAQVLGDYCAEIQVKSGFSPSAQLVFYAKVPELVRVGVHIASSYRLGSSAKEERAAKGKLVARTYTPNKFLHAHSDKFLSFSTGDYSPIKTAYDHYYLFVADDGKDCTEFSNFRAALETINEATK